MNKYYIEHKIFTLTKCATIKDGKLSFEVDDVKFIHWDEDVALLGWATNAWVSSSVIEAKDYNKAINIFRKKLEHIIPKISLISQSYIEYINEPFLIHKHDNEIAFLKFIKDFDASGLLFTEKQKKALDILVLNKKITKEFYYYWKDASNVIGYSAKLLLMFSAIEALVKKDDKIDWELREKILGKKLSKTLFGQKRNSRLALRNRLVHGEYFSEEDGDYFQLIHNKIIKYFNDYIFQDSLLYENVKSPQRNFYGNKQFWEGFIRKTNGEKKFNLIDLLNHYKNKKTFKSDVYELALDIKEY
jgi:hypothetical protein